MAPLWRQKHKCSVPKWILRSSDPILHFTDGKTEATGLEMTWPNLPKESEDRTSAGSQISRFLGKCCSPALCQLCLQLSTLGRRELLCLILLLSPAEGHGYIKQEPE